MVEASFGKRESTILLGAAASQLKGSILCLHCGSAAALSAAEKPRKCMDDSNENMLLIRGDTRVADIYLTEFDRIFRHFYFRDVASEIEAKGGEADGAFLDETSKWIEMNFKPGTFKTRRREMFFAAPVRTWVADASMRKMQPSKGSRTKTKNAAGSARSKGSKNTGSPSTRGKGLTRKRRGKAETSKGSRAAKRAAGKSRR